jgi:hypothetical protein
MDNTTGPAAASSKSRKALKEQYKQRKPPMGVYQIRNKQTGRCFISFAPDFAATWRSIEFRLEMGGYTNEALQADWKAMGSDNFAFEILHELAHPEDPTISVRSELQTLEKLAIEEIKAQGIPCYNK